MPIRLLPAVLVALVLTALASPAAAQDEEREVVVRVGLPAAENNLNPFLTPEAQPFTHDLIMLVYDSMFWSQSSLDPEPWLATAAEPSADFRSWTISLRDGVQWHDGQPFTADDVAFTFQYFRDVGGPGRYGRHVNLHPVLQSATVIDPTTVQLDFAEPIPTFELMPGGDLPILPKHIWEGIADPRADTTSLPVGTGPYRMVDHQPGTSYRLEANDAYFLDPPVVDTLELTVMPDPAEAYADLEAGELDLVAGNTPVDLTDEIERNEELDIIGGTRSETVYLAFDTTRPGLADRTVRKAISLAIDVDDMLNEIEGGNGRLGTDTWTHPNSPWTRDPEAIHLSDLLAAEQLLDSAGYTADGDGVRQSPDGVPLSFTLGLDDSNPNHRLTAEMLTDQLSELGVSLTTEPVDVTAATGARGPEAAGQSGVDLLLGFAEAHAHDDPDHLFFLFDSSAGGVGQVFSHYANPAFDALVRDALDEPEESRKPLIHQAQDILAEDIPVIALYYPAGRTAYRPAAYDGWWSDAGHGVFTKRAMLAAYADDSSDTRVEVDPARTPISIPDEASGGDGGALRWVVGVAIAAVAVSLGTVAFGMLRRRRADEVAAE